LNSNDAFSPKRQLYFHTVISPNSPPQFPFPSRTIALTVGDPAYVNGLGVLIVDKDGDPVTTSITTLPQGQVAIEAVIVANEVRIKPLSVGFAIAKLNASDDYGGTAQFSYLVTVAAPMSPALTTGIDEQIGKTDNRFFVYPNPFQKNATLVFNADAEGEIEALVYDGSGKMVWRQLEYVPHPGTKEFPLDGSNLISGIYYARILRGGKSIASIRIVKN
ncbi:MAG TPA: T9SS type A sorting domain-containing protein, partial [Cyclobacteriaceae bacterium]|nr:T9SS type A sorting domain-containing protein [Cyclobacteriaceae bacterium]